MGQMATNRLQAYMPIGDLEHKRDFAFTDIRGYRVLNTTGHKVGTVKDIFVDPNTLEPRFALLDYGRFLNFNTKSLLVAWEELHIGDNSVQTRPSEEAPHEATESIAAWAASDYGSETSHASAVSTVVEIQTSLEMSPDRDMSPQEPVDYDDLDTGDLEIRDEEAARTRTR